MNWKVYGAIGIVIATIFCITCVQCLMLQFAPADIVNYSELGIPLAGRYKKEGVDSRLLWDMEKYGDSIICGGGDYSENAGPVNIWKYQIEENLWKMDASLFDEAINRFTFIGDMLVTPGADAMADWEFGNFYAYDGTDWKQYRTIPGGLHVFDITGYDDKIFVGLGVGQGDYPIAVSTDNGESFSPVVMKKNGEPFDTSEIAGRVRVYDLFVLNGTLYAFFTDDINEEIYRYDNGVFVYENSNLSFVIKQKYTQMIFGSKAEFAGKMFLTGGYLYETADMTTFDQVSALKSEMTYDLYVSEGALYILSGKESPDGGYTTSVWRNETGDQADYVKLFEFDYPAPPLSMVYDESDVYIGMGGYKGGYAENGMLLRVSGDEYADEEVSWMPSVVLGSVLLCYGLFGVIKRRGSSN